ncbi:MAG TPA: hypothetical protein VEG60_25800 [Candidatus Binatia bacterium]|nr:hypothetical protein [Candidatus Binatia bacterium]
MSDLNCLNDLNFPVAILSAALTHQEVIDWGWRIPFLASAVILVIGLALRIRFPETPVFRQLAESGVRPRNPIRTVFQRDWVSVLKCASIVSV